MRFHRLVIFGFYLAALAACGGGGSAGSAPNVATVPTQTQADECQSSQVIAAARNDALRIDSVRYLQVVEQDSASSSAVLVSRKALRLRVDLLANSGVLAPVRASAIVFNPSSGNCETYALSGPSTVPTQVDNTRLDNAFIVDLPANSVQPGFSITIVFDDSQGRSSTEAARVKRVLTPALVSGVNETVRVIPLRYDGQNGFATASSVKSILERTAGISTLAVRLENVITPSAFNSSNDFLIGGSPGQFNSTTLERVLEELDTECDRLNGAQTSTRSSPKCLGVFPDNVRFFTGLLTPSGEIVGVAYVGGKTMMTQSLAATDATTITSPYAGAHWLDFRAVTVAHEYGHLLNLLHAGCGVQGTPSSSNYNDGRIGTSGAGYDTGRGFYFSATQRDSSGGLQFGDLMSYCEKEWPSDRGYIASARYRAGGTSSRESTTREVPSKRWLKITHFDGVLTLRGVYTAPATLAPTAMRLQMSAADGQHERILQRALIADMPLASANGPYYVELPTSAVESLSSTSWQLLGSSGQLISSGIGELLSHP
ncbi:MAG: hypothetical protein ABIM24_10100 [Paraperlucidibaca sp.]